MNTFLELLLFDRNYSQDSKSFNAGKSDVVDEYSWNNVTVKSKETVGNSWTVLKIIMGYNYHHNH